MKQVFHFQDAIDSLGQRVLIAVVAVGHRTGGAVAGMDALVLVRAILDAAIGVVHQRLVRSSVPQRHLIGGRLVATDHGAAGMFIYEDANGTRVALLVRPMAIERNTPMKENGGSLAGYTRAQDGLGYSVVGAEDPGTLHPLANKVRRQTAARS